MDKAIESDITNRNAGHHHDEHEITIPDVPADDEAHEHASESAGEHGDHNHHAVKSN